MAVYLTETDLVRALATELHRAGNGAEEIAADVALALGLAELEASAVGAAVALSENLDRAAIELRNHSLEIEDLERSAIAPNEPITNFREPDPILRANP